MNIRHQGKPTGAVTWTEDAWDALMESVRERALASNDPWRYVVRAARHVMRSFTTGFFMVSRFLPAPKRDRVEVIYAAVRYPDEVVDTLAIAPEEKLRRLDEWAAGYDRGLACGDLRSALEARVPCFVAGFAQVIQSCRIPPVFYHEFLDAMRRDVRPRPFQDLDDLIETYVYGSAVVVGYFLAHVYGAASADRWGEALSCARELGIALQLTNFARDVVEDDGRGRRYVPVSHLRNGDWESPAGRRAAVRRLAEDAERRYAEAARRLDAFAEDSRIAIRACINVYGALNRAILRAPDAGGRRLSVPFHQKWRVLPCSKYWILPRAYLQPSGIGE
ncbi:MAG: squalene/phytoene synthase family protein [Kiritimatiellae bacterium]|nr:squalene/phytoene synthase family protein [Kiritimatiellia bacterium]